MRSVSHRPALKSNHKHPNPLACRACTIIVRTPLEALRSPFKPLSFLPLSFPYPRPIALPCPCWNVGQIVTQHKPPAIFNPQVQVYSYEKKSPSLRSGLASLVLLRLRAFLKASFVSLRDPSFYNGYRHWYTLSAENIFLVFGGCYHYVLFCTTIICDVRLIFIYWRSVVSIERVSIYRR